MKILIATGIYPPHAGGPSYYAKSLREELKLLGHKVAVRTFTLERWLPTGMRHAVYFLKTLPAYLWADATIVMDTFSVAVPVALMKKWFGKKMIIRTGGDFLWEQYVERTGNKVLFSEFYTGHRYFNKKEQTIFRLMQWALSLADHIVFNSEYQRRVWKEPYNLDAKETSIIENAFQKKTDEAVQPSRKDFVCIVRDLKWKNTDTLMRAFVLAKQKAPTALLDMRFDVSHEETLTALKRCYCAILVSLGDISPNLVSEALSYGKPVILTRETGLTERLGDIVLYVDPLDEVAITDAVVQMCNDTIYKTFQGRVQEFSFVHSYKDIAREFTNLLV
ncbi:MAG: hypothetical protein AMXMBFR44_1200 [Candidatus Campbellbacteria bacterium]